MSARQAALAPEVSIRGVRSPLRQAGNPVAEEAVVFVHGNPGSSEDWSDLVPAVGAFGRAVAYDMPGFGHADKPADFPYTMDGLATHLGDLLASLGIRRVHQVLHDGGGDQTATIRALPMIIKGIRKMGLELTTIPPDC